MRSAIGLSMCAMSGSPVEALLDVAFRKKFVIGVFLIDFRGDTAVIDVLRRLPPFEFSVQLAGSSFFGGFSAWCAKNSADSPDARRNEQALAASPVEATSVATADAAA